MKRFQLALAFVACSTATMAMATPTPTPATYSFGTASAPTNGNQITANKTWGNAMSYAATSGAGPAVTITAWGTATGQSGNIAAAFLDNNYATNNKTELAITSKGSVGGSGNGEGTPSSPNGAGSNHAIDNDGGYESLLLSFASAVTLNTITLGYPSGSNPDSDMTVLEYVGGAANPTTPSNLTNYTYASLLSSGWIDVSQAALYDVAAAPKNGTATLTGTQASAYWMIGAYMAIGGNSGHTTDGTGPTIYDAVKVNGFTATRAVPEPGSIALFGIAGAALFAGRRRRAARKA